MKISGIYKIQSIIKPERVYIGSSQDIKGRWRCHLKDLRRNKHTNKLQRHYNKYGEPDLVFTIIEPCFPQFLIEKEQFYINQYNPYFNNRKLAESNLGVIPSLETRKKMSDSAKVKYFSDAHRKNISIANKGKIRTEETRKKISMSKMGHKLSEEACKKISIASKGRKTFLGRTHSLESKRRMSEARTGKKASIETKLKMSISKKNNKYGLGKSHPCPESLKVKLSNLFKGRRLSDETKKKLSVATKEYLRLHPMRMTDEIKQKISISRKGIIPWNKGLKTKIA
jgi:group I intron endonuclease